MFISECDVQYAMSRFCLAPERDRGMISCCTIWNNTLNV